MFDPSKNATSEEANPRPSRSSHAFSGVAPVSVGCSVTRTLPRSFGARDLATSPASARLCLASRLPCRRSEDPWPCAAVPRGGPDPSCLLPRPLPCGSVHFKRPFRSGTCLPHPAWQARLTSVGHRLSVRGPSWDIRLSRCLDQSLRTIRPAAVRRISLPAPLAGFAPEILHFAPIRRPGEAQPSRK